MTVLLAVIVGIGRAILPWAVRHYVNRTLDQNQLYSGTIGPVHIHILRGAYSIDDIKLSKTTGDVPVPFISARSVAFAIQWGALLHGKIVGQFVMNDPELNFVDAPSEGASQSGAGGPWLQMIRDLFPFQINSAVVRDGAVHFRSYIGTKPVDVYLSHLEASIDNLTNIGEETTPLPATVKASALAMDQARLQYRMTLDPFSYHPTFHMALQLLGLDVTTLNPLALTYGKFDFKRGWLDLVIQTDANEGHLNGYIKPLFRDLKLFSLRQDIKEDSVLQFFWQALVGMTTTILKNQPRKQFGTLIPFTGETSGTTSADILATIGNVLRNAFVRAYLPRLQNGEQVLGGMQFQPPDITASPIETQ
ncbi:MAG TPA: DUF748 domain-containing protein [Verrucomicrobiae bacterium]|nr:DUF748 domain-containing protein [Verrucomicrobiae bacterium]